MNKMNVIDSVNSKAIEKIFFCFPWFIYVASESKRHS